MLDRFTILTVLLTATLAVNGVLAQNDPQTPPAAPKADSSQVEKDSETELRRLIQSSGGSEETIMVNLESYLVRYPQSERREEIEEQIYKLAVKVRDRDRTISYAEKQLATNGANADDIDLLTTLVSTLRARKKAGDLTKALGYAERLVTTFEKLISESRKPGRLSQAQWQEQKNQGLASIYLVRGRVLAELDQLEKASADLRRSIDLFPLGGAALTLSEILEKQQRPDEALKFALQSFVLAISGDEQLDLKDIRRRMGTLYLARKKTESGLGDLLLETWDRYTREREERSARIDNTSANAGVTDPLLFKLTRVDGSPLDMSTLRGKVVVMNFWATWCGPCRTELPLFQKTIEKYRSDQEVVFLAISTDEDRENVQPYLKQNKHDLPVVFAENIDSHFNVSAIPTTIILNRGGQVAFRMRGFNPNDDFVAFLSEKIEAARK
ncbi:MAG: redoxin family protein [Acidobacteriota bacterium]